MENLCATMLSENELHDCDYPQQYTDLKYQFKMTTEGCSYFQTCRLNYERATMLNHTETDKIINPLGHPC